MRRRQGPSSPARYTRLVLPWVIYSLARIGVFLALFAALMVLGVEWWISAICATLMALSISYLAFSGLRARMAEDLAARASRRTTPTFAEVDASAEDAEVDGPPRA